MKFGSDNKAFIDPTQADDGFGNLIRSYHLFGPLLMSICPILPDEESEIIEH